MLTTKSFQILKTKMSAKTSKATHKKAQVMLAEISSAEWLFGNQTASREIKQGLQDSAAGRVSHRGNFAKYIDEDSD